MRSRLKRLHIQIDDVEATINNASTSYGRSRPTHKLAVTFPVTILVMVKLKRPLGRNIFSVKLVTSGQNQ